MSFSCISTGESKSVLPTYHKLNSQLKKEAVCSRLTAVPATSSLIQYQTIFLLKLINTNWFSIMLPQSHSLFLHGLLFLRDAFSQNRSCFEDSEPRSQYHTHRLSLTSCLNQLQMAFVLLYSSLTFRNLEDASL